MDHVMWHRGSPEADGHLLVMPVRAELSQYRRLLKTPRFKMGHCAPKIAAINTASEVCGACFCFWNLETGGAGVGLPSGFQRISSSADGSALFFNLHQAGGCCINNFFPDADLAVAGYADFPWRAHCCSAWEWCLISSQKRSQNAMQQCDS